MEGSAKGPCFNYHLKKCIGVCVNEESVSDYNSRVEKVISHFAFEKPSFILLDTGRNPDETSVVCVENGNYRGFGFVEGSINGFTANELKECIQESENNRDVQSILRAQIYKNQYKKLINL